MYSGSNRNFQREVWVFGRSSNEQICSHTRAGPNFTFLEQIYTSLLNNVPHLKLKLGHHCFLCFCCQRKHLLAHVHWFVILFQGLFILLVSFTATERTLTFFKNTSYFAAALQLSNLRFIATMARFKLRQIQCTFVPILRDKSAFWLPVRSSRDTNSKSY